MIDHEAVSRSGPRIHPVAAIFPLLRSDELQELAEDIRAHGLQQPIVLDADGVLIDGRNRLAACALADVEPRYEVLPPGTDALAFILSANVHRRQMTKGQLAMVMARARLVSSQTTREAAAVAGMSQGRIWQASTVLQWAPDLADGVLDGSERLDQAYALARQRKENAERRAEDMGRLSQQAPDLADDVTEEQRDLHDAVREMKARERKAAEQRAEPTMGELPAEEHYAEPPSEAEQVLGRLVRALVSLPTERLSPADLVASTDEWNREDDARVIAHVLPWLLQLDQEFQRALRAPLHLVKEV